MNSLPQNSLPHIFIIPFLLNLTLFSKSSYLTYENKLRNNVILEGFPKKTEMYPGPSRQQVRSFQSLTNFRKNPNIGSMGVLHASLEYYDIF